MWLGGTPVDLTGSWEYSDEARRNFDLDARRERHRRVREHEVKLEARAGLAPDLTAFVQAVALHETRTTQGTPGRQRTHEWQRGEMWLQWDRIGGTPWSLQVGRVPLLERRSLWWDDDLDAVRLRYAAGAWRVDTGLGRPLARVSSAEPALHRAARCVAPVGAGRLDLGATPAGRSLLADRGRPFRHAPVG
jgi:alginate production protein